VDLVIAVVAAVAGFLAGLYGVLAIRSRPRIDRPRCATCGADARAFAWRGAEDGKPPRCDCGVDLSRAGSVSCRGHEPVLRLRRLARVTGAVAIGIVVTHAALLASGHSWLSLAPANAVGWLSNTSEKRFAVPALAELERRADVGSIDPGAAWEILAARSGRHWDSPNGWAVEERLLRRALVDRARVASELGRAAAISVSHEAWLSGPAPTGTLTLELNTRGFRLGFPGPPMARIEAVEIDGVACDWALIPTESAPSPRHTIGRTVFLGTAALRCIPIRPIPQTGATLTIRATVAGSASFGWWLGFGPHDPLIDGDAPPEEWGTAAITATVTSTHQIAGPSQASSQDPGNEP
jgi:hypothetical protein